jgi:hypothetical protein
MKMIFAVILVLVLLSSSCGHVAQDTVLQSMLSEVPSEVASNCILWFSNIQKMKELTGEDLGAKEIEYFKGDTDEEYLRRQNIFSGWNRSRFSGYANWSEYFGYNTFDINLEIWAETMDKSMSTRPLFSVMRGNFDTNTIDKKLTGREYRVAEYAQHKYYSIYKDFGVNLKSDISVAMPYLNRMMVTEKQIIAAPSDELLFSVLDVRSGKKDSLVDSPAYTRVAAALGDVMGAAFVPESQLFSENVNKDWSTLHDFELIGIGYSFGEEIQSIVIVIYYPDDSAVKDIDELQRRMGEYELSMERFKNPQLPGLFDITEPQAVTVGSGSLLKTKLVYKKDTPRSLWVEFIATCDLGFLVADPSAQN